MTGDGDLTTARSTGTPPPAEARPEAPAPDGARQNGATAPGTEQDYRATLNLPREAIPMRANLAQREPEIQALWERLDVYRRSLNRAAPRGPFILHDGPPYSNGDIHMGHALNKILKDFITRHRTMAGFYSPYVPGWDNHGLPIEYEVTKEFRTRGETPSKLALRQRCRKFARRWVEVQKREFQRLGVRGEWDNPYLTMDHTFEAKIVEVFAELVKRGFVYHGLKPVYWCPSDETALAEAEIEYTPKVSPSIYVLFPLRHDPKGIFPAQGPNYTVAWTTTPWTIPANLALAFHPDVDYVVVRAEEACYLLAEPLVEATMHAAGIADWDLLSRHKGAEIEGTDFWHPLRGVDPVYDRPSPAVLASYVTVETGTGVVHTAPGHGEEDFRTGLAYGLRTLSPVDDQGRFTAEAGPFAGLHVFHQGNDAVNAALQRQGALLGAVTPYEHQYPHCWRCHGAIVFRATNQWFMKIDHNGFRQRALKAIQGVRWHPAESINRITAMVAGRPDWCLSRQRSWGVGIPAFYCESCGEVILTEESLAAAHRLVREWGSDAWFAVPAEEILPRGFQCPHCGGTRFTKETDILDVWFDSGATWAGVLEEREGLHFPAEVYLEGSDQHRGWFNSSLMLALAVRDQPPYQTVITNGWMLDETGRAMHKSWGNAISPEEVVKQHGADVLRLWVSSADYFEDVRLGPQILQRVTDAYRRIRNTFRFLLGNLYDFDPATDAVSDAELPELDRWALHRLALLLERGNVAYETFEFHRLYHAVHTFCAVDLSAFYLDVIKDRLYTSVPDSRARRSAQTVLWRITDHLARLLAPILVFTCEEVWSRFEPGPGQRWESIHLAPMPDAHTQWRDDALGERWDTLLSVRDAVNRVLEEAKAAGIVERPLAAVVTLTAPLDLYERLAPYADELATLFIVSQALLRQGPAGSELTVEATPAGGRRCDRCWLTLPSVGARSEHPALCERCAEAVMELARR
ncbi:MAG: isoleucine--tRNA ligase [Armatimonadetes bacterium]|nr:isoleucine--tRNA ligase [Armatimonadota bacterium]